MSEISDLALVRKPRRWLLRLLGVPFHMQDTFLDPRRWSVTVTSHAIKQAGERYRQGDPKFIALDVVDALCHSRIGDRSPDNRNGAKRFSVLAWSADQRKVYVLKRRKRTVVVVTALPTAWSESEATLRAERDAARREHRGSTAFAQAFETALARHAVALPEPESEV